MERYFKKFKEDEDNKSLDAIKDLIDLKNIKTDEDKGKFQSLIKGLIFADTDKGNKFLNDINDFTSSLKVDDYK